MNQLIKQFLVYGLGATVGKFLAVLLLPIYASVFSPDDYGNLDLILTIGTILSTFGILQLETGLQRFYYECKSEYEKTCIVYTSLVFVSVLSILTIVVSFIAIPFLSRYYFNGLYIKELFTSILIILPVNITTILFIDFRYKDMTITYVSLNLILVVISALCSIFAVKILNSGIFGVILSSTGTYYLICIITLLIWLYKSKKFRFNKSFLYDMIKFSLPQFPARLGSLSNSYINRFFMVGMLSVHAIGIFAISLRIASAMQLIQMAFTLAWLPYMYKLLSQPNHKEIIASTYLHVNIILSFCVILLSLFSKEILLILTNKSYQEASLYVPILAYYYVLYTLKEVVDIGVKVSKKTKYTSYLFVTSTIVNIILLSVLTPSIKLFGVSISLLLSNVILFYSTLGVSQSLYKIPFSIKGTFILNIVVVLFIALSIWFELTLLFKSIIAIFLSMLVFYYYRFRVIGYIRLLKISNHNTRKS